FQQSEAVSHNGLFTTVLHKSSSQLPPALLAMNNSSANRYPDLCEREVDVQLWKGVGSVEAVDLSWADFSDGLIVAKEYVRFILVK
ncbi:hypothetical protein, partial [Yersinia pekkanenii]|uniref:hypothetical protein n=1 Tax=Yersinia pekkanenii TaxID=1288385 RepID=UPI00066FDC76